MKRAALIATGTVLVILGLLTMAAGGAAAALFGSDGSLSTAPARVSGSGVALVVEDIAIDASSIPVPEGVGTLTLSVSNPAGRTMFVGASSGDSVDTYLTGAPYDVVVAVAAGSNAVTRAVPGTQKPPPPTTQSIWTQQATGSPAQLTARVRTDTTLVVMNADATPGVDADLVVTLTVARAWSAAWIAVGVGALLVVLGIVAFWRARVARRRALAAVAAAPAPVVAAPGATILPGAPAPEPTAAAAVGDDPAVVPAAEPTSDAVAPETAVPEELAAPTEPVAEIGTDVVAPEPDQPVLDSSTAEVATDDAPAEVPETAPVVDEPVYAAAVAGITGTATSVPPDATEEQGDPVEPAAAPVDMAALFAPVADDADRTAEQPAVPAVDAPPSPAPAESQHPAG